MSEITHGSAGREAGGADGPAPAFEIYPVPDKGDGRGSAFFLNEDAIRWLGEVRELHVVAIAPGKVRGNHMHHERREVIFVSYDGAIEIAWREPGSDRTELRRIEGHGGFVAKIEPRTLHAFRNAGEGPVQVVSMSNGRFDPSETEYHTLLA